MGLLDKLTGDSRARAAQDDEQGYPSVVAVDAAQGVSIARAVTPRTAEFKRHGDDCFALNGRLMRVLYVRRWPTEVDPNWLREIYQWPRDIDVSVFYLPLARTEAVRRLRDKLSRDKAELEYARSQGQIVDEELAMKVEDAERLRRHMQRNEADMFDVSILVMVRADDKRELDDLTAQLRSHFEGLGASLEPADKRQKDGLLSMLPLGRNYVRADHNTRSMQTDAAAWTFPLANADIGHPDGLLYGINVSTNSNVFIDRYKLPSPHAIICGNSGSGKSMAAKIEVLQALMDMWHVMVIDPEAEFHGLCQFAGGRFVSIGPNSPHRLNPMDFSAIAGDVDLKTGEPLDVLTPKIVSVCKLVGAILDPGASGHGLGPDEFKLMDQLLKQLYAQFQYTQDPQTQAHATPQRMPIFSDLKAALEAHARAYEHDPRQSALAQRIADAISPFCQGGMFGGMFDEHTNVPIDDDPHLVVFDIQSLSRSSDGRLLPLGMHAVLEHIWTTTLTSRAKQRRRMVVVDEAHVPLRFPETSAFFGDFVRRARKYRVAVTCVTQDPADFFMPGRPDGKAIFDNSSLFILFKLKQHQLDAVAGRLEMDRREIDLLKGTEPGVGIMYADRDRAWLNMRTASPAEYAVINTNPEETAQRDAQRLRELEQQAGGGRDLLGLPPGRPGPDEVWQPPSTGSDRQ